MKKLALSVLFLACTGLLACTDETCEQTESPMIKVTTESGSFYIDAYEASRANATAETFGTAGTLACSYRGTFPWGNITYEDARIACLDAGKRLCTQEEWMAACGKTYPYGDSFVEKTCNDKSNIEEQNANLSKYGSGYSAMTTGQKSNCKTPTGIYDMSGNLREWVQDGILMGGAFNSESDEVRCTSELKQTNYSSYVPNQGDGFRCCKDATLSE